MLSRFLCTFSYNQLYPFCNSSYPPPSHINTNKAHTSLSKVTKKAHHYKKTLNERSPTNTSSQSIHRQKAYCQSQIDRPGSSRLSSPYPASLPRSEPARGCATPAIYIHIYLIHTSPLYTTCDRVSSGKRSFLSADL